MFTNVKAVNEISRLCSKDRIACMILTPCAERKGASDALEISIRMIFNRFRKLVFYRS